MKRQRRTAAKRKTLNAKQQALWDHLVTRKHEETRRFDATLKEAQRAQYMRLAKLEEVEGDGFEEKLGNAERKRLNGVAL